MRDVGVIEDGVMLIENGLIQQVGSRKDLDIPIGAEVVDAKQGVVLPGFVDAHTHLVFGGNRADEFALRAEGATYEQIAQRGGGIRSTMAHTRAAADQELEAIAVRHATQALSFGTTTLEAKSGYGLSTEHELRLLRAVKAAQKTMRVVPTLLGAHAFPPEFQGDREGYVAEIVERMLPQVHREGLAHSADIFIEQGYFTQDQAGRILGAAMRLGLHVHMHVDQLTEGGGGLFAAEIGRLALQTDAEMVVTADHLEQTASSAFRPMKEAGVYPVLLPASVFCLGKTKYPDARGMIDADLPVILATDFNPGSSPTLSMPFIMSLAMTQLRMTAEEALIACTANPGAALTGGHTGQLAPGRAADFTVWDCKDWREIPYWVAMVRPSAVYVGGTGV